MRKYRKALTFSYDDGIEQDRCMILYDIVHLKLLIE